MIERCLSIVLLALVYNWLGSVTIKGTVYQDWYMSVLILSTWIIAFFAVICQVSRVRMSFWISLAVSFTAGLVCYWTKIANITDVANVACIVYIASMGCVLIATRKPTRLDNEIKKDSTPSTAVA
ncbi:MAG: hypothetical protein V1838_01465 [Patescibacteria group bacterium]